MRALVTGAAGFIGSNLTDRLLAEGWSVRGVDRFTAYYGESTKRANLGDALRNDRFELIEADLLTTSLEPLFDGVDVVFHLAGQPGVRLSWADGFRTYVDLNVTLTQRLLDTASRGGHLDRFVYASSSSVYGQVEVVPTPESAPTRPFSPYGVTKLAGEHLCSAYAHNYGLSVASLRYFSVYGPRQRPDMAMHRIIDAGRRGEPFSVFGDGTQVRDYTFVDDVVRATILAAETSVDPGTVLNVAGGASTTLLEVIGHVGDLLGEPLAIEWLPAQPGDVARTGGDVSLAAAMLGWSPRTQLLDGLAAQVLAAGPG